MTFHAGRERNVAATLPACYQGVDDKCSTEQFYSNSIRTGTSITFDHYSTFPLVQKALIFCPANRSSTIKCIINMYVYSVCIFIKNRCTQWRSHQLPATLSTLKGNKYNSSLAISQTISCLVNLQKNIAICGKTKYHEINLVMRYISKICLFGVISAIFLNHENTLFCFFCD
jgi:hypothetical protein